MASQNMDVDKVVRFTLIALIVIWSFQLIYPLFGVLAWGCILSVILFPFYTWINKRIGNKPLISASIITLIMILLVAGIAGYITQDVAKSLHDFSTNVQANEETIPKPPASVEDWPLIGKPVYDAWSSASVNLEAEIKVYYVPLMSAGKYVLDKLVKTSKELFLFIVAIIFSGFLLTRGDTSMGFLRKFARRLAKQRGDNILKLIRQTIQSVSRGVLGIALLQSFILAILLLISGTPGIGLICLLALILCIVQLGLYIVIVPVIIWLFLTKSFAFALIMTILLILDALLENILKPIVLARGLHTPMIVIFIGVIGGILVYGLVGIFIGPVVLSIAYDLMLQWIEYDAS